MASSFCLVSIHFFCSNLTHFFKIFLLHFRFWSTCVEHARQLHRYTNGSVFCFFCPLHPFGISPHVIPPQPPYPLLSLPYSPANRPQCVMLPSLCPYVLIVQHPSMSETMWYFIFCSCVSLLRMMVSRFIHVPTKDRNSLFWMAA